MMQFLTAYTALTTHRARRVFFACAVLELARLQNLIAYPSRTCKLRYEKQMTNMQVTK